MYSGVSLLGDVETAVRVQCVRCQSSGLAARAEALYGPSRVGTRGNERVMLSSHLPFICAPPIRSVPVSAIVEDAGAVVLTVFTVAPNVLAIAGRTRSTPPSPLPRLALSLNTLFYSFLFLSSRSVAMAHHILMHRELALRGSCVPCSDTPPQCHCPSEDQCAYIAQ